MQQGGNWKFIYKELDKQCDNLSDINKIRCSSSQKNFLKALLIWLLTTDLKIVHV